MAITRTPIIDDSGSGTDGTVIDNAWKQEFYNQIDALTGGFPPVYGTFTPSDLSGAGIDVYARDWGLRQDRPVDGRVSPSGVASDRHAGQARIGGLPVVSAGGNAITGAYQVFGIQRLWYLAPGMSVLEVFHPDTMAAITNANLSGSNNAIIGVYLTA